MGIGPATSSPSPSTPEAAPRFGAGQVALLAALAILAFAGNSILARAALVDGAIDAASFSLVRLVAGALVLVPLLVRGEGRWSLSGGASLFVYVAMFSWAYVELPTATGALILFAVVQATILLTGIARGERVRLLGWIGLVVSLTGLAVLLVPQVESGRLVPALFMAASAVIVNVGAVASHAAIVSRELGIPCAVSVLNATDRVPEGATVTVTLPRWTEAG